MAPTRIQNRRCRLSNDLCKKDFSLSIDDHDSSAAIPSGVMTRDKREEYICLSKSEILASSEANPDRRSSLAMRLSSPFKSSIKLTSPSLMRLRRSTYDLSVILDAVFWLVVGFFIMDIIDFARHLAAIIKNFLIHF